MTIATDELSVEELRQLLAQNGVVVSAREAADRHKQLYGDRAARDRLLARRDWSDLTPKTFGRRFPMFLKSDGPYSDEIAAICECVREGCVTLDLFRIPVVPPQMFSSLDHGIFHDSRGKDEHRLACVHAYRWMRATFPSDDLDRESRYDSGVGRQRDYRVGHRYDIGSKSQKIAIECGFTVSSKVFDVLEKGWTIISVPYHKRWGLVAFRFTPVNVQGITDNRTRRRAAFEERRRAAFLASGKTKVGQQCVKTDPKPSRTPCVDSSRCDTRFSRYCESEPETQDDP